MVVLDTCSIIEAFKQKPGFSSKTIKQIEAGAYVLSVSFAEIACKVKLGKLDIGISPKALFEEISQIANMQIIDISVEDWLNSIELQWPENKDPADRLITAFAIKRYLPIVTSDTKIKTFYKNVLW